MSFNKISTKCVKTVDNYDIIVYNIGVTTILSYMEMLMNRMFVYSKLFLDLWDKLGLTDEHLRILENRLLENPQEGDVIPGLSGARKIRFQIGTHGKSGGGRAIYIDVVEKEKIYFLLAYPKNVQENLTSEQKKIVKKMIDIIKE